MSYIQPQFSVWLIIGANLKINEEEIMSNQRYALLSVSNKEGIEKIAQELVDQGITILSTGGTFCVLEEAGIPVKPVEEVTEFPEIMDGRVKTLHPKIHGGLLGLRNNADHQAAMNEHSISPIDFVIVNLYPFQATIEKPDVTLVDAIENIDIGGPSMLRSAAKNYQSVSVVTDPRDYDTLIHQLQNNGETTAAFRQYLARKVYQLTAYYDGLIGDYLAQQPLHSEDFEVNDWDHLTLSYTKKQSLRYGENSHQTASFYSKVNAAPYSLAGAKQLHGKALSYNNIKDANAALKISQEFDEPAAIAVKHMNPCGVAIGEDIDQAFDRCFQADPISIFGGIIVLNRQVDVALAERLHNMFLEIIIAPSFTDKAFDILAAKKNIRLMTVDFTTKGDVYENEYVSVNGGMLVQSADKSDDLYAATESELPENWEIMTERQPDAEEIAALNFTMKVCKHVKSNAIVVGNQYMTYGIGAGQMNRVGAAEIALNQADDRDEKSSVFVMASDAFLPMNDTVALANQFGVSAIIQPGGSIKDKYSVEVCNEKGIAMVKTSVRHFRH